jgi:hypothetical protein
MLQVLVDAMENRLSSYRRWNDHPPLMAIFPFTNSDLVKMEYEFRAGIMNMVSKSIDDRFEKSSQRIKPRILLWNTFGFKKLVRVTPKKRINPFSCDISPKSLVALMQQFGPVHRHAVCCLAR